MIKSNVKYQGMFRAKVVEVDGEDKEYGAVRVYIPDVMSNHSDDTVNPDSSGILAYPGNNSMGGYNAEDKDKSAAMQACVNIPLKNSWVWVWFEGGDMSRPFYGAAFQYRNSKLPPENTSVKEPHKVYATKTNTGRSFIFCDSEDKARVEITGKRRKQTATSENPEGKGGEYDIDGNMNTILMDERDGKEKILMKSHKGDFFKFDVQKRKLQVEFESDIVIKSKTGRIVMESLGDIEMKSTQNISQNATMGVQMTGGGGTHIAAGAQGISISSLGELKLSSVGPFRELSQAFHAVDSALPHFVQSGLAAMINPIMDAIMNSGILKMIMKGLNALNSLLAMPMNMINAVTGQISQITGQITGAIDGVVGQVTGAVDGVVSGVTGAIGGVMTGMTGALDGAMSGVTDAIGGVTGAVDGVVGGITEGLSGAVSGLTGAVDGVVGSVTGMADGVIGSVTGMADSLVGGTMDSLTSGLGSITAGVSGNLGGITANLNISANLSGELVGSFSEVTGAFDELNGLTGEISGLSDALSGEISSAMGSITEIASITESIGDIDGFAAQLTNVSSISDSISTLDVNIFSDSLNGAVSLSSFTEFDKVGSALTNVASVKLTTLTDISKKISDAGSSLSSSAGMEDIIASLSTVGDLNTIRSANQGFAGMLKYKNEINHLGNMITGSSELKKFAASLPFMKTLSEGGATHANAFGDMCEKIAAMGDLTQLKTRIEEAVALLDPVAHSALITKLTRFATMLTSVSAIPNIENLGQTVKRITGLVSAIQPDKMDTFISGMTHVSSIVPSAEPYNAKFSLLTNALTDAIPDSDTTEFNKLYGGLSNLENYDYSNISKPLFNKHTNTLTNLKGKIIGSTSSDMLNAMTPDVLATEMIRGIKENTLQSTVLDDLIGSAQLATVVNNCITAGYFTSELIPETGSMSTHIITGITNGNISPVVLPIILDSLEESGAQTLLDKMHTSIPTALSKTVNDAIDPQNMMITTMSQLNGVPDAPADADAVLSEENLLSAAINHVKSKGLDSLMKMIPKEPTSGSRD